MGDKIHQAQEENCDGKGEKSSEVGIHEFFTIASGSTVRFLKKYKIVTEIKIRNNAGKLLLRKYGLYLKGNNVEENAKEATAIRRFARYFVLKAFAIAILAKKIATGATKKDKV